MATAHPPNASVSQTCACVMPRARTRNTVPHGRTTASPRGTTSGHGSTSTKCHLFRKAGGHLQGLRNWVKLFPATHPHTYLFIFALQMEILVLKSEASAQQQTMARISTQQLCLPTTGATLWKGQTRTDGAQDTAAMPRQMDLYLTAAAVTAWRRKSRGHAHSPPKCTQLEKNRCFHNLARDLELIP